MKIWLEVGQEEQESRSRPHRGPAAALEAEPHGQQFYRRWYEYSEPAT